MKNLTLIFLSIFSISSFAQSTYWSEYKLKEHWQTNGIDNNIEGIYEDILSSYEISIGAPKYKYGVLKTNSGYKLLYLSGANGNNAWRWKEGDIKAYLSPTATPYLFKVKWYMGDKSLSENLYITFKKGLMQQIWTDGYKANSLKIYPTANDNITQSNSSSTVSSGSGFAISSNGILVTNYHVIEGVDEIRIRGINSNFDKTYKARVLVFDKNNDLALIKINDYKFTSLGTIPYTFKSKLANVGENIFALGYPLKSVMGDEIKLTNGIISSKTGFKGDVTSYQVSAPVQPGNSGGPLFDSNGNVIGIINAKLTIAENASYAIKVNYLLSLIELLNNPPKLQKNNTLKGKSLSEQVQIIKRFVYIIETE